MRNVIRPMAENYQKEHIRKRRRKKVFSVLASIVVFCTTYALILPAITWERSLICELSEHTHTDACYRDTVAEVPKCVCGSEEHTHTDACYERTSVLICTSEPHSHGEECYSAEKVLKCDDVSHEHTDACYEEIRTLVCEKEIHEHGESCYASENVLACDKAEHIHTEECFSGTEERTERVLMCGLSEHTHTDACFDAPPAQDEGFHCGLIEHTHSGLCYFEDGTLRCTIPEHLHELQCASDPDADTEDARTWEETFADVELSGIWADDVLAIADSQLGYCESQRNYEVEDGVRKGYTRYGEWYGLPYGDWCAMFCSFCINYAQVKGFPIDSSCRRWTDKLKELELFHPADDENYVPKPGDLVFFDWNEFTGETEEERVADHVGFVLEIFEEEEGAAAILRTVEGNWGGSVCYVDRDPGSDSILGYGEMPENPDWEEPPETPDSSLIRISVTSNENYIYLSPILGEIEPDAYTWQWQYSETGGEPWSDVEDGDSLICRLDNDAWSAVCYYRIYGTPEVQKPKLKLFAKAAAKTAEPVATEPETADPPSVLSSAALEKAPAVSPDTPLLSAAVTPMAASASVARYYWQPITGTGDLTADGVYLITTKSGDVALYGASQSTAATAGMQEAGNKPGYYVTSLGEDYWWTVSQDGSPNVLQNISTGRYLRPNSSSNVISTTSTSITYTYSSSNNGWRLSNGSYYLRYSGSSFSRTTSSSNAAIMTIYKQEIVFEDDDDDPVHGGAVKPTYASYLPVSSGLSGDTVLNGVPGQYWSDPSTSQLEGRLQGIAADDGIVLSDKSVVYGGDDYGAFEQYDPNTFGVTLSALGQTYSLQEELEIPVPLDVVFVLDTSGSMVDTKHTEGNVETNNANIMVESLNNVMRSVLDANELNRVGVVCFSGGGHELLPLGHYSIDPDPDGKERFFEEGIYNPASLDKDTLTLKPKSNIIQTDLSEGETLTTGQFTGWWGTYTQHGIATGAKLFLERDDTTVSGSVHEVLEEGIISATYTFTRQPIFILLSDGDPTYCTDEYDDVLNADHIYGNGNSGFNNNHTAIAVASNNNKGILGYYTILSAQAYKDRITEHYGTDAHFYSIGIGMYETGSDSYEQSVSGDDYKRAVLNPTAENISALANCTNSKTDSSVVPSQNRDISGYSEYTCHMLNKLLNNQYSGTSVTISSYNDNGSSEAKYGVPGRTSGTVPVISNPYRTVGYDYADDSFFTTLATIDNLTEAFTTAVSFAGEVPIYGFILRHNTAATVTDTIGTGMEIKGAPVLRFEGQNFCPTGEPAVSGNVTTYHYEGTVAATDVNGNPDGSGHVTDISEIYAEVETVNGVQTVRLVIPDAYIPTYSPHLSTRGVPEFYYESLPVRLLYQVGLTEDAKTAVGELAGTGNSLTYYTNAWSANDYSYANYQPTTGNPYYGENGYDKSPRPKTDNATGTSGNSAEFDPGCNATHVSEHLGNNGKLTFTSEYYETVPLTIRKVDPDGNPISTDTAVFELFSDAQLENSLGTYETDENGAVTIPKLRVDRTYYIVELRAPQGYEPLTGSKAFTVSASGEITGIQEDEFFSVENGEVIVINDFGHISVSAEKRWLGELQAGESYPASVQFQLYSDGEPYGLPVTLNSANSWQYIWENLPSISRQDHHEFVYTVQEAAVEGYVGQIETDGDGRIIITNRKLTPTSLSVLKKWEGGSEASVQVELLKNDEPTGLYATLNAANSWYYMWSNLPDYDENGALTYSVREIAVEGYDGDVHLWTGPGDPYGQTDTQTRTARNSFTNGKEYVLTFYDNERDDGSFSALISNDSKNGLEKILYTNETAVTDRMLWRASISSGNITFTNVYANKQLVLNSSNQIALGTSGHATSWTYVEKSANNGGTGMTLQASYRSGYRTYTYYFNVSSISGGTGAASTNNWMFVYPYEIEGGITEDPVTKGDVHYIVKNIRQDQPPGELTVRITKTDSETGSVLAGAVLALYRETGDPGDPVIPGTADRHGVVHTAQWTSDGHAKTVGITQNGTYYLTEISPPNGYEPLAEPVIFEVTSSGSSRTAAVICHPVMESGRSFTDLAVPNTPDGTYSLPETGGIGTISMYALGGLLVAVAFCGSFLRRKRERRTN